MDILAEIDSLQKTPPPSAGPTIIEAYRPLAEQAVSTVQPQIAGITRLVENLKDQEPSVRTAAIGKLKGELGFDLGYDPQQLETRQRWALGRWDQYVKSLAEAVEVRIPKLMEESTSRNKNHRAWAVRFLGVEAAHPAFLPILWAVVENPAEPHDTRQNALAALSNIPHEGMVEYAIERLDGDLAFRAWQELQKLTGHTIPNDTNNWLDVKRQYEQWWAANKGKYVYSREQTLRE